MESAATWLSWSMQLERKEKKKKSQYMSAESEGGGKRIGE
jgi:hypothetical protein